MYEITEMPLHPEQVIAAVADRDAGAVVAFVGTVRSFSRGRRVEYLEYDAYATMAARKLAEIGAQIKSRWGLDKVAIVHRVGRLEVGEASVVIAVASPHRKEAFEACEFAINALKSTVPIWKKEVWEGGEVWIEGEEPTSLAEAQP